MVCNDLCIICKVITPNTRHGLVVCNACRLFSGRENKKHLAPCKFDSDCCSRKCGPCRKRRCSMFLKGDIATRKMLVFIEEKKHTFLNNRVIDGLNPTTVNLVYSQNIDEFIVDQKPRSLSEWNLINRVTTVFFFKKFDVFPKLFFEDQLQFIEANEPKQSLFALAFHCFKCKLDELKYTDGENEFPIIEEIFEEIPVLKRINHTLLKKLNEVKPDDIELALLSAMFACNPANAHEMSEDAQIKITAARDDFHKTLFKYCCNNVEKKRLSISKAGDRYLDLMAIESYVVCTQRDIQTVTLCKELHQKAMVQ